MLLIVLPKPVHGVIVLRVAYDGVDVIGFLNGEFDDQPRSMHPIVEGAANVVGGAAPGKMQLLEASPLNGIEVPLGRVGIGVVHVLFDQREQQLLLWRLEIAGGKALESAQAVSPAHAREHVGEKRLGGHDDDPSLLRMEAGDEIKAKQTIVT